MPDSESPTTPRTRGHPLRLLLIGLSALLVLVAGYTTWANLRTHTLTASVDIDAPPDEVWNVLIDRASYPVWNPFIVTSTGGLKEGGTITNELRAADGSESTVTATVVMVRPDRELRWTSAMGPGLLFDGERSFRLTERGAGTRLVQTEDLTGALVPLLSGRLDGDRLRQLKAMNRALKRRVAELG